MRKILMLLSLTILIGCAHSIDIEKTKLELANVERTFSATSVEKGFYEALRTYMADETMFLRDRPITDKNEIHQMLSRPSKSTITWEPVFCDVAASGDLGYTYGPVKYSYTDSTGNQKLMTGYYITIWKKQPNGSWKFVMDTGTGPKPEKTN
jgi:ketosteroid isomerase-like protein